jgi:hypothetical protein
VVGRPDATVWIRAELGLQQVLVVLGRPPAAARRLDALAAALLRGRAPLRVASVDPASGSVGATDVDAALLGQAAEDVVAAAEAILAASRGVALRPRPHPGCWSCWRQNACAEGTSWRSSQPTRRGGLPVAGAPVNPSIPTDARAD